MENSVYHAFRKPKILKGGKKVHRWYYYWLDAAGKQHQSACRGCRNRSEAENYIRTLAPPPDTAPAPAGGDGVTIGEIAETMYIPGSAHVKRRIQLGKSVAVETMAECRRYTKLIIALWGGMRLRDLGVDQVMPYLFNQEKSGKWKNRFLEVLGEVYTEAPWYHCRIAKPAFQRFSTNSRKADIFTTAELDRLFRPENFPNEMYYLFFLLCLSGGLRLGEVRAIRVKQIIFDRKVLIVDGFCKPSGERTIYNKKGTPDHPHLRLVYLPDMTLNRLAAWIAAQGLQEDDFCFTINGKPVRQERAQRAFYEALQKTGLIPYPTKRIRAKSKSITGRNRISQAHQKPLDGRKLVPHSLRYTYVSRMRRELSAAELQPMSGHASVEMVDYYNRKMLDLALESLPRTGPAAANTLFA
ncbi:MAG: tyrosine-type recombinase/integrase [Treponema sp.]|jgi:integrase|nr:tyrosine-type recombinase/integrase [Treponema sp.]